MFLLSMFAPPPVWMGEEGNRLILMLDSDGKVLKIIFSNSTTGSIEEGLFILLFSSLCHSSKSGVSFSQKRLNLSSNRKKISLRIIKFPRDIFCSRAFQGFSSRKK